VIDRSHIVDWVGDFEVVACDLTLLTHHDVLKKRGLFRVRSSVMAVAAQVNPVMNDQLWSKIQCCRSRLQGFETPSIECLPYALLNGAQGDQPEMKEVGVDEHTNHRLDNC